MLVDGKRTQSIMTRILGALKGQGYIRHSSHSKKRCFGLNERGFANQDVVSILKTGTIRAISRGFNHRLGAFAPTYIIHGKDRFNNWSMMALSDEEKGFLIITIGPATDRNLFGEKVAF
jgi:hypothetical protein